MSILEDDSSEDDGFDSIDLGNKNYWVKSYTNELKQFEARGDVGDVWFGEDTVVKIVNWIKSNVNIKNDDRIIDFGCGNGVTLLELAREGYTNLLGIDYCEQAVQLARSIAQKENLINSISYDVCDLTNVSSSILGDKAYSVALDKGTYDTILLNTENGAEWCKRYIKLVRNVLKPNGFFVIVSCNSTQEEIVKDLEQGFQLHSVIPTPSYKFATRIGYLVTFLVFQKIDEMKDF